MDKCAECQKKMVNCTAFEAEKLITKLYEKLSV